MRKIISLLIVLFTVFSLGIAQNNTSSPYSSYGLGELNTSGTGQSSAFANTSLTYKDNSYFSLDNPASIGALDSMKFIFNLGLSSKYSNLSQRGDSDHFWDNNISEFSFGFRVAKFMATAVSIKPYTNVGYNVSTIEKVNGSNDYFTRKINGTGGLNQFVLTNGFNLSKKLFLGVNTIFMFGNNRSTETVTLGNAYNNVNSELISEGVFVNFGMQYHGNISENTELSFGGRYQPKFAVRAKREMNILNSTSASEIYQNTTDKGSFDVPMSYGAGLGFTYKKQLWIGADYNFEKWSDTEIFKKSNNLVDRSRYSLGVNYDANDGYATKFLKKLSYRFGAFYDNGYIEVEDQRIKTTGITFGVGIPMAQQKGIVNIGFEIGQMGTTENDNIREDYVKINLGLSLHELWFFKRKYQ